MEKENYDIGEIVLHKVTGFKMVVIGFGYGAETVLNCRYYNDKTGYYHSGFFEAIEFNRDDI
jgi:uncharacterized protein YodC (DUF2158 family)